MKENGAHEVCRVRCQRVVARFILLSLVYSIGLLQLRAHGDLHEQIARCTRQIQQQPANAELLCKRAELYRLHGEWNLALADCSRAEQLMPELAAVNLVRGQTLFEADKLEPAKAALDIFLTAQPEHPAGLLTRARVLVKLKEFSAAERDFTAAINNFPTPEPDYFLERAQVMIAEEKMEEALAGLDEGIKKLGPIVSLELLAIDLELREKRFDSALARVERISAQSGRKESWLALRGDILAGAGKKDEARAAFDQALAAIESLPPNRRGTKAMKELELKTKTSLKRLEESSNQP